MGIMNTGISGLLAFQRALATTSHNVANATKEGYSRQRAELTTHNPQFFRGSFLGQGVYVSDIRRIQDEFVDTQLRTYTANASNGEIRAHYAERIDRLLGDPNTGLAPSLGSFFNAANDVASDPTSMVARQVFLSEAESMVSRFNELNGRISDQRDLLNDQIKRNINEINSLSADLADLNRRVVDGYNTAGNPGPAPNDLLDQRGDLLRQLAEKVDIRTVEQSNGSVSVFIGSGQTLVLENQSNTLVAESFGGDPRNWGIGFSMSKNSAPVDVTRFITGGELGGLLESRSKILDQAQNEIGQIAVVAASLMNRQNNLGLDLDGNPGQDLFRMPTISVGADRYNTATGDPAVNYTPDVSSLTASDYRLKWDGANYHLTRLNDRKVVAQGALQSVFRVDGIEIDTNAILNPGNNDNWLIQPTRFAAQGIDAVMTDPAKVAVTSGALHGPENTGPAQMLSLMATDPADINFEVPAAVVYDAGARAFVTYSPTYEAGVNTGSATIEAFSVTDANALLFSNPADNTVVFDAVNNVFTLGSGEIIPLNSSGTTTLAANGWEMKIRGTPQPNENFDVAIRGTQYYAAAPGVTQITDAFGWALDITGEPSDNEVFTASTISRPGVAPDVPPQIIHRMPPGAPPGTGVFTAYSPVPAASNTGTGVVSAFSITDPVTIAATTVTYVSATDTFDLGDGTSIPRDPGGATTITSASGWEMQITGTPDDGDRFDVNSESPVVVRPSGTNTLGHNGWALTLYDEPAHGDVFSVEMNRDRVGDNRNMLVMAGLSDARVIGGLATFADRYNQTLGEIGTRTRQAQISRDSSIVLRNNTQTQRDSISGVNLDEEAANLLKFQKAYQAAAQVVAIGNSTFDSLFAMFR